MRMRMRMREAARVTGPESAWRERGLLFNTAAQDYLDGRPGYPPQVFGLLRNRFGLRDGSCVLEVGPGTGQATLPILSAGAGVTAVEPGPALAEALLARADSAQLRVMVNRFEDVELAPRSFDLVVSATAFHWVDPTIGFAKAARLLRPGGWLVVWWTVWGRTDGHDVLHERLVPLLAQKAPHLLQQGAAASPYAEAVEDRYADIDQTGLFEPVEHHVIDWSAHHNAIQARALFASFSPWLALPAPLRSELLVDIEQLVRSEFNDDVEREYRTVMYAARRRQDP